MVGDDLVVGGNSGGSCVFGQMLVANGMGLQWVCFAVVGGGQICGGWWWLIYICNFEGLSTCQTLANVLQ